MTKRKVLQFALWTLTLLWTLMLFGFSGQDAQESADLSIRLTQFILRLFPGIPIGLDTLHLIVRKTAHFGIFAIEGALLAASMLTLRIPAKKAACIVLPLCAVLACLNEYHQSFADGRYPSPVDAGIDTAGSMAGIAFVLLAAHLLRRRNAKGS